MKKLNMKTKQEFRINENGETRPNLCFKIKMTNSPASQTNTKGFGMISLRELKNRPNRKTNA
jgi:hypothetical protein